MTKTKTGIKTTAVAIPNVRNEAGKSDHVAHLPVAVAKTDNVSDLAAVAALTDFAVRLGVELSGSVEERAESAALHMSRSQRHMLAAGVLLMSIKAEAQHGRFAELLEERGFELRSAQRAMQYAQFVLSRPADEQEALIAVPHRKVLALASADPEVIEAMLDGGVGKIDALSVRALTQEIADLKANLADTQVQRDTAETEAEGLKKKLAKAPKDRADGLPLVVADLRAEGEALGKKAELAIDALQAVGAEAYQLTGGPAHDWAQPTLRLALARACALRVQLDGVIAYLAQGAGAKGEAEPAPMAFMTAQEVLELAQSHARLTALHEHEKALREWERAQARPRGKGRPAAKPEAPEGA